MPLGKRDMVKLKGNSILEKARSFAKLLASTREFQRFYYAREILKQDQYVSLSMEEQVISMWSLNNGYFDDVKVEDIKKVEADLLKYFHDAGNDILKKIAKKKDFDEALEKKIKKMVEDFKGVIEVDEKEEENNK